MTNFEEYNLKKELIDAIKRINFINPTEVQEKTIPLALETKDIIIKAKTGTGKTAAFLIPMIQMLKISDRSAGIIIVPTRELAIQVYNVFKDLSAGTKLTAALVYGGSSIGMQIESLRKSPNIIIGTPGRIIDLMQRKELIIRNIRIMVLDEADMMLDLGFMDDIEYIISTMPKRKQVMLFSATMPERIMKLSQKYMNDAYYVNLNDEELTVDTISHKYALSNHSKKLETLLTFITEYNPKKSIIFSGTKRNADFIYNALISSGYKAEVMHGDLKQPQRERALQEFRKNAQFLVATNVAARGLDIKGISDIINYDIPSEPYVYVHRVGRSARMGADGSAFTIVSEDEIRFLKDIEKSVRIRIKRIGLDSNLSDEISSQVKTIKSMSNKPKEKANNENYKSRLYNGTKNKDRYRSDRKNNRRYSSKRVSRNITSERRFY